jgi:formyltetrahydrofolate synthetase
MLADQQPIHPIVTDVGPMKRVNPVPSDLEIAQAAELRPILEVAESIGLSPDDLELFGRYKAKVHLDVLDRFKDRPQGKYIDITAITPTLKMHGGGPK